MKTPMPTATFRPDSGRVSQQGKHRITIVTLVVSLLLFLGWGIVYYVQTSPRARLERLNAARAIANDRNVALDYARMLSGEALLDLDSAPNEHALKRWKSILREFERLATMMRVADMPSDLPWRRHAFPTVAEWLDRHVEQLQAFARAAEGEQCVIPVRIPWKSTKKTWLDLIMSHCLGAAKAIKTAAYLDLGEGRLAASLEKALTLLRIGHHLQQQPTSHSFGTGSEIEQSAMQLVSALLLRGIDPDALDDHQLEFAHLDPPSAVWKTVSQRIEPVEALLLEHRNKACWRRDCWRNIQQGNVLGLVPSGPQRPYRCQADAYLTYRYRQLMAARMRFRVLHLLSIQRSLAGAWPTSLETVSQSLGRDLAAKLIDQVPFVHGVTPDAFVLYAVPQASRPGREEAPPSGMEVVVVNGADAPRASIVRAQEVLESCIERFAHTRVFRHTRMASLFRETALYSGPILLKYLVKGRTDTRSDILRMLDALVSTEATAIVLQDDMAQGLFQQFRAERDPDLKLAYCRLFAVVEAKDQQASDIIAILHDVIRNTENEEVLGAALLALSQRSSVDAAIETLRLLKENDPRLQNVYCALPYPLHIWLTELMVQAPAHANRAASDSARIHGHPIDSWIAENRPALELACLTEGDAIHTILARLSQEGGFCY